jgi:hypothetical protein
MMQPHAGAPVGCSKCLGHYSYRVAVLLPVWRGQYHAHRPLSPCLCYLYSPHRWHCGFCPLTAEGRLACGKVEGFAIRRSVTRARGRCRRYGLGLITRAHWRAPREGLRICK